MIGILSDAHGNYAGFEKGFRLLRSKGARKFVFLGDALGYIPSLKVLDALRGLNHSTTFLLGNHESAILSGEIDGTTDALFRHSEISRELSGESLEWLQSWRSELRSDFECGNALFVHGSPSDPQHGYVYPDTDLTTFSPESKFIFMGHTHRPFIRDSGNGLYVNVGSCGLPRDDGRYGAVCLVDECSGQVEILRYDLEKETEEFIRDIKGIHRSVQKLFERRTDDFFGEIVE